MLSSSGGCLYLQQGPGGVGGWVGGCRWVWVWGGGRSLGQRVPINVIGRVD